MSDFAAGQYVHALWKGRGRQYDAIVLKVNPDTSLFVLYSDGDMDSAVPPEFVTPRDDPLPDPWECDKCKNKTYPFFKACPNPIDDTLKCGNRNPRFIRAMPQAGAFGRMFPGMAFRRPKPAKITLDSLKSWPDYFREVIEPRKQTLFVQRPADLKGSFPIDDDLNSKILLYQGDITALEADAVVNAANESLWAGGGICGVIHSAAGPQLEEACREIGHTPTGQTVITPGFELYAKHVLHSVGPTNGSAELLTSCYRTSLEVAHKNNLTSVVFCCISTGIFGFPNGRAALIALSTARAWLTAHRGKTTVNKVVFCTFTPEDRLIYDKLTPIIFPVSQETVQDESKEQTGEVRARFKAGDNIACVDRYRQLSHALVLDIKDGQALIHYHGEPNDFNEWMPVDSPRIMVFAGKVTSDIVLKPLFGGAAVQQVDSDSD